MPCSHCGGVGHTYRRCPTITEEEKKEKILQNKENAERRIQNRQAREERLRIHQQLLEENKKRNYTVTNITEHEVVLYWGYNNGDALFRFTYISPHSTNNTISLIKKKHRIVGFPFLEVCKDNSPDAMKRIEIGQDGTIVGEYKSIFDMKMDEYSGNNIVFDFEYTPQKSEIEQWKECALKSKFLLDELIKLGANKYDNLEPILDLVQDISLPNITEVDKELAGIPSTLTNIT